ncbi:Ger(x)C family spore germination protein [Brevibacillus sp. B_LB10_24]|uniref:Ger(x)C family spore germination protein n=1 Tax=Brevibacillus sp. B_LB10_24 TaxID=3380645 RepID=UPI0038BA554B
MNSKVLCLVPVIALMPLLLGGCYDKVELEEVAFVAAVGIDEAPDNQIDVSIRVSIPRKLAGQEGTSGGSGEEVLSGAKPVTVRAKSIIEAITLLQTNIERRLDFSHMSNFVFSESLARKGLIKHLRPLSRYREFRRTITVSIAKGQVRELLLMDKPILEQSVHRLTQSINAVMKSTGQAFPATLHTFLYMLETTTDDPVVSIIAVNKEAAKDEKSIPKDKKMAFVAGEIAREGGNPVDFAGTALFSADKLVAMLDTKESRMLTMIRGEMPPIKFHFTDPLRKKELVSLELKHARPPKLQVDLKANPIRIHLSEKLEATLIGVHSEVNYTTPKNMSLLEKQVGKELEKRQEELMNKVFHTYQCEPFGILSRSRGQFATFAEIEHFDRRNALKNAIVDVDVKVEIRRIGSQLRPVLPR